MEKDNKNFKVFLVDDDEFLLDMYASKFKMSGFDVEIARNGKEALSKLKEGLSPDVILLDIVMPEISGFEFLETLKEEKIPMPMVVVLSNLGQKSDIEKGKKLGASDYIIKASFTPSEVVQKVRSLLGGKNI
ncbi:response regulator [Patescibacteria group bacterium]|nr:response regulator [Patescibacteria group bacterium]MBU2633179.1 response regulator [Patescibacteria group bacterium]